ncbi:MAG: extracellular solute-binding protein [Pleurocapsa sp. SU_196_0]|nr:extracellular solute-binding protein [Pleurocapsa sp. SU_196_0]
MKQVSFSTDVYAVPVDTSPVALVYRADLLTKYGVSLPTTWAQVVTASQKVFSASKGKTRFFNFDTTSSLWFLALAQANGARIWASSPEAYTQNLMHPNAVKLAETLEGLLSRGTVTKFPSGSLELHKALRDGALVSSAMPLSGAVSLSRVLRVPGAAKVSFNPRPRRVVGHERRLRVVEDGAGVVGARDAHGFAVEHVLDQALDVDGHGDARRTRQSWKTGLRRL